MLALTAPLFWTTLLGGYVFGMVETPAPSWLDCPNVRQLVRTCAMNSPCSHCLLCFFYACFVSPMCHQVHPASAQAPHPQSQLCPWKTALTLGLQVRYTFLMVDPVERILKYAYEHCVVRRAACSQLSTHYPLLLTTDY